MKNQELYEGFDPKKQKEYEEFILTKYGEKVRPLIQRKEKINNFKKSDFETIHMEMTLALKQKKSPKSPGVQEIIARHFEIVSRFYDPTKQIYSGLGDLYKEHPDFRKLYDSYHPELAEFLAEAMKFYAEDKL